MDSKVVTPLPWRQVYILLLMRLADPLSFTVLFPFVYFMVKDFHLTEDEAELGFYVGIIASSFAFSQMLTVLPWGLLSDRIGRRPVILSGLIGTATGLFMFGLSQSLGWAIVTRSMAGLLSGNVGVIKTVMGELTNESNRAQGFSLLPMAFGMGSIIGPSLGGYLSNPMEKYPDLFGDGVVGKFLTDYPYFLPCGICSFIILISFIVGVFYLEETLILEPSLNEETPLLFDNNKIPSSSNESSTVASSSTNLETSCCLETSCLETNSQSSSSNLTTNSQFGINQFFSSVPKSSWVAIFSLALQSLVSVTYSELLPLWAATPIALGGLGFDTSDIGSIMAFGGIALLIIQLLIYPTLQRRLGTLYLFRSTYLTYIFVALLFPVTNLVGSYYLFWGFLLILITLQTACNVFSSTSVSILIVETCPDPKLLGKTNGLALASSSFVRAIGPTLCGIIYSWSLSNNSPIPLLHAPFTWIILATFAGISLHFAHQLPSTDPAP